MIAISDIAVLLRNGKSVRQNAEASGLPITRIETIADGTINPSKVGFADLSESDCTDWLLRDGDILISHINSTKHLGKCAIYEGYPSALIHGMNLLVLRVDPFLAAPRYVYRMLSSPDFRRNLPRITKDSVNQSSFNISSFKKLQIPLPPLDEQRRIAEILDKADALRIQRRTALTLLKSLNQSVFLDLIGDPATNPKGWPISRVGTVAKQIRGVTYTKGEASKEPKAGYLPILRAGNIDAGDIVMDDLVFVPSGRVTADQLLKKNDILIATSSGSLDVVGKAARVQDDMSVGFGAFCKVLRPRSEIDPIYFATFFSTQYYRRRVSDLAAGININNLRNEHLDNFRLPMPPRDLQRSFATIVTATTASKVCSRGSLSLLNGLFRTLQHRAFNGDL